MWDLHNMSDSVISNIIQQLSIQQQNKLIIWLHSESKKKINTDVDKVDIKIEFTVKLVFWYRFCIL